MLSEGRGKRLEGGRANGEREGTTFVLSHARTREGRSLRPRHDLGPAEGKGSGDNQFRVHSAPSAASRPTDRETPAVAAGLTSEAWTPETLLESTGNRSRPCPGSAVTPNHVPPTRMRQTVSKWARSDYVACMVAMERTAGARRECLAQMGRRDQGPNTSSYPKMPKNL